VDNAAVSKPAPIPLDTRTLLARINQRIALLRAWLSHDHRDAPYWWARMVLQNARDAQAERQWLRVAADLLHVERATARGKIHGTRFATLEAQRAWLASMENRACSSVSRHAGLPSHATLAKLRAGELFW
jgi:hypothetical protein